jgi:methylated-DNA-[protein]-cysteine S-methyltransferase
VTLVRYALVDTVHGPWWLAWNARGACGSSEGDRDEEDVVRWLRARFRCEVARGDPADAPAHVDWESMPDGFRGEVLRACHAIPAGETRSYGDLARAVGRPGAARAVGTTMATNPLPLLIPCHRVVRGDGLIGQYGAGGPERKAAMLAAEGVLLDGRAIVPPDTVPKR